MFVSQDIMSINKHGETKMGYVLGSSLLMPHNIISSKLLNLNKRKTKWKSMGSGWVGDFVWLVPKHLPPHSLIPCSSQTPCYMSIAMKLIRKESDPWWCKMVPKGHEFNFLIPMGRIKVTWSCILEIYKYLNLVLLVCLTCLFWYWFRQVYKSALSVFWLLWCTPKRNGQCIVYLWPPDYQFTLYLSFC